MWALIAAFLVLCFNILRVFSLTVLTSTKKSKFQLGEKGRARVVAHRGSRSEGKIVSDNDAAGFVKFLCTLDRLTRKYCSRWPINYGVNLICRSSVRIVH